MPKYKGKLLKVELTPTSGSAFDASGASRTFEESEKAGEIDVTTRESTAKEYLDDFADIEGTFSGLDVVGGAPVLELNIGDTGVADWYPEGEVVGKRKRSASYKVMEKSISYPYDGAVEWTYKFRFTTAISETTVSA